MQTLQRAVAATDPLKDIPAASLLEAVRGGVVQVELDDNARKVLERRYLKKNEAGEIVGTIHANDRGLLEKARSAILTALAWNQQEIQPLPHIYETILG